MSIITDLTNLSNFTATEKDIAKYILKHSDEVINMSIAQLAELTYSNNAAIIRLCKKLNCSGFKDFKISYAQELEKHRNQQEYVDVNYPFHLGDQAKDIMHHISALTKSAIDNCYHETDYKSIEKAASLINNSNRVYLYANGDSSIRAASFQNKLIKINKYSILTSERGELTTYANFASKNDCAVFISYSGSNQSYLRCMQIFKARQCPIILITAKKDTSLAKLSDITIFIPDLEDNIDSIATFYSQIAFEYILNVIYSLIFNIQYSKNHEIKRNGDLINRK